jgi:hypothetical protein
MQNMSNKSDSIKRALTNFTFSLVLMCPLHFAQAKDRPSVELFVGLYQPDAQTQIRYDEAISGDGTTITLEDDLNVDNDKALPTFQLYYHLTKRWTIEFGYFDFSRTGRQRINTTIDFGDGIFEIDTNVNTQFDAEVFRLNARYGVYLSENITISGIIGVHATDFDLRLDASDDIEGLSESLNEIVPVPLIGALVEYRFNEQFALSAKVEYIDLEVDDIQGGILNSEVALDYSYSQSFGLRLAYTSFQIDGETDDFTRSFTGLVDYRYRGPELLVRFSF